jgi:5-methylcytosine-specific restriction endonuclease McrA
MGTTSTERMRKWLRNPDNRAKKLAYMASYCANPDVKEKKAAWRRKRRKILGDIHREYQAGKNREYYAKNPLARTVRAAIGTSLRGSKNNRSWKSLVPYTLDELKRHLERQFTKHMTWDNYGIYWHLDHIVPVRAFNFTAPEDEDFKACWALTNLRPLESKKNLQKGGKRTHLL